jgi:hypothetical protein
LPPQGGEVCRNEKAIGVPPHDTRFPEGIARSTPADPAVRRRPPTPRTIPYYDSFVRPGLLVIVVALASCADEPASATFEERYCEALNSCVGGNAADVAGCIALTSGSGEWARILGCGAEDDAWRDCTLRRMTCVGTAKPPAFSVRCHDEVDARTACATRNEGYSAHCGVVAPASSGEAARDSFCHFYVACRCGTEPAVRACIAAVQAEERFAEAYACGDLWRALLACNVRTQQCANQMVSRGFECEAAFKAYDACHSGASARF